MRVVCAWICDVAVYCVMGFFGGLLICFVHALTTIVTLPCSRVVPQSLHTPDPVPVGGFSFDPATRVVTTPQTRSVKMERTIGVSVVI
jgi:hypothetical protein